MGLSFIVTLYIGHWIITNKDICAKKFIENITYSDESLKTGQRHFQSTWYLFAYLIDFILAQSIIYPNIDDLKNIFIKN